MAGTILIVDDSVSVRAMLKKALSAGGHDVLEAGDGTDALVVLDKRTPDLVITDVNMGQMDGLTLCSRIRERHDKGKLPVLVLTTESSEDMRQRGRAVGASGWLIKPFDQKRILTVVSHVLQQRAA